jgi:exonuclease III
MANSLRIIEWNANGLLQHQHELEIILSTENTDVCLISETHFTKESFIRFKNYITYHTIHVANTARGVRAVIIRNNIKHFEEEKYITCDIQATIVTLETSKETHGKCNLLSTKIQHEECRLLGCYAVWLL